MDLEGQVLVSVWRVGLRSRGSSFRVAEGSAWDRARGKGKVSSDCFPLRCEMVQGYHLGRRRGLEAGRYETRAGQWTGACGHVNLI